MTHKRKVLRRSLAGLKMSECASEDCIEAVMDKGNSSGANFDLSRVDSNSLMFQDSVEDSIPQKGYTTRSQQIRIDNRLSEPLATIGERVRESHGDERTKASDILTTFSAETSCQANVEQRRWSRLQTHEATC